ncbi:hypothetical protein [Mesorhizobium sp. CN2-181]|uniref:hypothetical protein n=1 Tax=Mesorhizobium yinganensis TaxID=3157707 RepID=UPI0032B7B2D3
MPNTYVPAAGGALPTAQPTIFLTVTPDLRLKLATTIENLIALLDTIDGDEDLEPALDDEPGTWTEFHQSRGHTPVEDENLEDNADAEDGGDSELSLGSPGRYPNAYSSNWIRPGDLAYSTGGNNSQETWASGSNTVRSDECEIENEHGGDVLDVDHDASTWGDGIDQSYIDEGAYDDAEPDCDAEHENEGFRNPQGPCCEIAFRKPDGIIVREVVSC